MADDTEKPSLMQVLSLEDLIAVKRHIARAKDRAVLEQLESIKRLRDAGE
jgi:hypothetical protein